MSARQLTETEHGILKRLREEYHRETDTPTPGYRRAYQNWLEEKYLAALEHVDSLLSELRLLDQEANDEYIAAKTFLDTHFHKP
jgi:hypothetical protein